MQSFLTIKKAILPIDPEVVGTIGGFPITNSFLMTVLIMGLIILFSALTVRRFTLVPSVIQNAVEYLYESMMDLVDQITGNRKKTEEIFPLIGTLFIFIGIANLIGFIPGLTDIQYNGVSLFRIATTDFNTTFGLAFAMILFVQFISIKEWGILAYLGKFFKFKGLYVGFRSSIGEGFTALIEFFVGLLDIISEIAKVVSLSLRLFGNMYAGEVLAILVLGSIAFVLPAAWMALNLLFAIVQTLVFALLVTAYYSLAQKSEEEQ